MLVYLSVYLSIVSFFVCVLGPVLGNYIGLVQIIGIHSVVVTNIDWDGSLFKLLTRLNWG